MDRYFNSTGIMFECSFLMLSLLTLYPDYDIRMAVVTAKAPWPSSQPGAAPSSPCLWPKQRMTAPTLPLLTVVSVITVVICIIVFSLRSLLFSSKSKYYSRRAGKKLFWALRVESRSVPPQTQKYTYRYNFFSKNQVILRN